MQNTAILWALMIGTTEAASSDVQPITSARLDVVANIWLTAGTASAGPPRASTLLQVSLCPSTPPALLTAEGPPQQEARDGRPTAASTPRNGATSAIARAEPGGAARLPLVPPQLLLPLVPA